MFHFYLQTYLQAKEKYIRKFTLSKYVEKLGVGFILPTYFQADAYELLNYLSSARVKRPLQYDHWNLECKYI